jgi:hypothetical protein
VADANRHGNRPPVAVQALALYAIELTADELEATRRVRDSLRSIRFGTVLIVVQDGKVVQIETAEKIRLR